MSKPKVTKRGRGKPNQGYSVRKSFVLKPGEAARLSLLAERYSGEGEAIRAALNAFYLQTFVIDTHNNSEYSTQPVELAAAD